MEIRIRTERPVDMTKLLAKERDGITLTETSVRAEPRMMFLGRNAGFVNGGRESEITFIVVPGSEAEQRVFDALGIELEAKREDD